MEGISNILKSKKFSKSKTNKIWVKAEEVAKLTGSTPQRWLRAIKQDEWAMDRALVDFKEALNVRSKVGLFLFLYKKYKS